MHEILGVSKQLNQSELIFFFFFKFKFFLLENHYAAVSQANWCNMIFTAGNLFPSHSCIGWPESSPHQDLNPCPQIERRTTYQLSYPSTIMSFIHALLLYNWYYESILHMVFQSTSNHHIKHPTIPVFILYIHTFPRFPDRVRAQQTIGLSSIHCIFISEAPSLQQIKKNCSLIIQCIQIGHHTTIHFIFY